MPIRGPCGGGCHCGGTPNFTISAGTVQGCNLLGMPNAVLTFGSTAGASNYGTLTANSSGAVTGMITVPGTVTVHWTAAPAASDPTLARWTAYGDHTFSASPGGSINLSNIPLQIAAGYHCSGFPIYYPLKVTLHVTDGYDIYTYTVTWSLGQAWQSSGSDMIAFQGCSPCTPGGSFARIVSISGQKYSASYNYITGDLNRCPDPGGTTLSGDTSGNLPVTSSYPFQAQGTLTTTGSKWYCNHSSLITVTE